MSTDSFCLYSSERWANDLTIKQRHLLDVSVRRSHLVQRGTAEEENVDFAVGQEIQQNDGGFLWMNITSLCSFLWRTFLRQIAGFWFSRGNSYIVVAQQELALGAELVDFVDEHNAKLESRRFLSKRLMPFAGETFGCSALGVDDFLMELGFFLDLTDFSIG